MRPLRSIERLTDDQARPLLSAPYNYSEVGATQHDPLPAGCRTRHREIRVGSGLDCFDRLAGELLGWRLHRRAGLSMLVSADRAQAGVVSVAGLPVGPFLISAPCRVVYVITEPRRVAFAYGTLPGHPLAGEERFEYRLDDDQVWFGIRLFSRPATALARLGGPITDRVQGLINRRYLTAAGG